MLWSIFSLCLHFKYPSTKPSIVNFLIMFSPPFPAPPYFFALFLSLFLPSFISYLLCSFFLSSLSSLPDFLPSSLFPSFPTSIPSFLLISFLLSFFSSTRDRTRLAEPFNTELYSQLCCCIFKVLSFLFCVLNVEGHFSLLVGFISLPSFHGFIFFIWLNMLQVHRRFSQPSPLYYNYFPLPLLLWPLPQAGELLFNRRSVLEIQIS